MTQKPKNLLPMDNTRSTHRLYSPGGCKAKNMFVCFGSRLCYEHVATKNWPLEHNSTNHVTKIHVGALWGLGAGCRAW